MTNAFYWLVSHVVRAFVMPLYATIEVKGLENMPATGPLVVASNHLNDADPGVLATRFPRRLVFMTKVELFKAVIRSVISSHFEVIRQRMETTELSTEEFLKGPFLSFIQELPGSRRAFIVRLLISEGYKHPEITQFYYENVISRGLETMKRLIDRGIERGEFKPTPLRDYPQLLVAPVLMAILWRSLFERHYHLDTDKLPRPLQIGALGDDDWQLDLNRQRTFAIENLE